MPIPYAQSLIALVRPLVKRVASSPMIVGSAKGLFIQILGKVVGIALMLFMTHVMTAHDFGVTSYARSWPALLGPVLGFGFAGSAFRFIPEYTATGRPEAAHGYIRFAFWFAIAAGAFGLLGVGLYAWLMPAGVDNSRSASLLIVAFCMPAAAAMAVQQATCRAMGFNWLAYLPLLGLFPLINLVLAGAVYLITGRLGWQTLMFSFVISYAAAMAYQGIGLRMHLPQSFLDAPPVYHVKQWFKVATPMFVTLVAAAVVTQGVIVIGGSMLPPKEVGLLSVCFQLVLFLSLIRVAVIGIIAPQTSAGHARGDHAGVFWQVAMGTALSAGLVLAGVLFFALFGPLVLFIFGKHFVAGYLVLMTFCANEAIITIAQPTFRLLTVTGREMQAAACTLISAAVSVGGLFYLTPRYGVEGAALSAVISSLLLAVLGFAVARPLLVEGYRAWRLKRRGAPASATA